jgi:hypothetical protein
LPPQLISISHKTAQSNCEEIKWEDRGSNKELYHRNRQEEVKKLLQGNGDGEGHSRLSSFETAKVCDRPMAPKDRLGQ